jgi:hypothetical protein
VIIGEKTTICLTVGYETDWCNFSSSIILHTNTFHYYFIPKYESSQSITESDTAIVVNKGGVVTGRKEWRNDTRIIAVRNKGG